MSSAAKLAANIANAQLSTGPRTEPGRATSSKNAIKSGLFAANDFIRPGEESMYDELDESLHADLAPVGQLEHILVDEIRRATWRLRRCGEVEASMVVTCAEATGDQGPNPIPDPMQYEPTAKLQHSVDRARAQCHRLLLRCTAELRKLQTERHVRNETQQEGADLAHFGLCDLRTVTRAVGEQLSVELMLEKRDKRDNAAAYHEAMRIAAAIPMPAKPTQTPRNSPCPCGSGQKHKRCCGKDAPAVLHAA